MYYNHVYVFSIDTLVCFSLQNRFNLCISAFTFTELTLIIVMLKKNTD